MTHWPDTHTPDVLSPLGAGGWALGLTVSACAHLVAIAALMPFLDPAPLPQQPSPQSALSMESQQVARSEAREQTADPEPSREASAQGESLDAGAVPRTTAQASSLSPHPIAQVPSQGERLASSSPTPTALTSPPPVPQKTPALATPGQALSVLLAEPQWVSAQPAFAQAVPLQPAESTSLTARPAAAQAVTAQATASQELAAATPRPVNASAVSTQALTQDTPPSVAQNQPLAAAATAAQQAIESPNQSEAITAALAFQGDATKDLDPASVAAFQSFTQPDDPTGQATGLRDGLAGLLGAVPCSRLQAVFDPDTATLELRGHLPENGLRGPVLAALQAQMGRDIALSDKMRLLPRPQCGALSGISQVGLPQSTDQITNPLLLGPDAQARVLSYTGGEQLYFDLTAPDYPAYLYVDYFDAAGNVLHLSPNAHIPLTLAQSKTALRVGAKTPEDPGLQITVGPPYGQEIAVAFAASSPLYEALRPLSEPAAPYLDFLRLRVAEKRSQDTDFKGEWVYFLIETHAN